MDDCCLRKYLDGATVQIKEAFADGRLSLKELGGLTGYLVKAGIRFAMELGAQGGATLDAQGDAIDDFNAWYDAILAPAVDIGGKWIPDGPFDSGIKTAVSAGIGWAFDAVREGMPAVYHSNAETQKQLDMLQGEYNARCEECHTLKTELDKLHEDCDKHRRRCSELEEECDKLRNCEGDPSCDDADAIDHANRTDGPTDQSE